MDLSDVVFIREKGRFFLMIAGSLISKSRRGYDVSLVYIKRREVDN